MEGGCHQHSLLSFPVFGYVIWCFGDHQTLNEQERIIRRYQIHQYIYNNKRQQNQRKVAAYCKQLTCFSISWRSAFLFLILLMSSLRTSYKKDGSNQLIIIQEWIAVHLTCKVSTKTDLQLLYFLISVIWKAHPPYLLFFFCNNTKCNENVESIIHSPPNILLIKLQR